MIHLDSAPWESSCRSKRVPLSPPPRHESTWHESLTVNDAWILRWKLFLGTWLWPHDRQWKKNAILNISSGILTQFEQIKVVEVLGSMTKSHEKHVKTTRMMDELPGCFQSFLQPSYAADVAFTLAIFWSNPYLLAAQIWENSAIPTKSWTHHLSVNIDQSRKLSFLGGDKIPPWDGAVLKVEWLCTFSNLPIII